MTASPPSGSPDHGAAGFWQRGVAWSIDATLIAPLAGLLAWPWVEASARAWTGRVQALLRDAGQTMAESIVDGVPLPRLATALLHDPVLREAIAATRSASWSLAWPALLAFALLGAAYHVACECSPRQASVGKRLLGLRACDRDGRRLHAGRAAARHFAGALSWATLNLGHLMAIMAPRHLALHDRCSGTRVVSDRGAPSRLPVWAWAWLGLLALAGLTATVWLGGTAASILRTALEQTFRFA